MSLIAGLYFIFVFYTIFEKGLIILRQDNYAILAIILAPTLLFLCTLLLFTMFKRVTISHDSILFVNPLIPSLHATVSWTDYDSCYTVQEYTQYKNYEAIWLIKDNRIKNRISSFTYSNYLELRNAIQIDIKGELRMSRLRQTLCVMGLKIKNIA
jgi:hypothetical protein